MKESLIAMIDAKVKRENDEEALRKITEMELRRGYLDYIRSVKSRIDDLLEVANYAEQHHIRFDVGSWGGIQNYDTGYFCTNTWSHLLGFIKRPNELITELGIFAGGACGPIDFHTNGNLVYGIKNCMEVPPTIEHLRQFKERFDTFESKFYAYIEKQCGNTKKGG